MGRRQNDPAPWILKNLVFENDRAVASGLFRATPRRGAGGAIGCRFVTNATMANITFAGNQAVGASGGTAGGGGTRRRDPPRPLDPDRPEPDLREQ